MARPRKMGLDYFPMDVHTFSDKKRKLLLAKFKGDGYAVLSYIQCEIHKEEGYSLSFDDDYIHLIAADLYIEVKKVEEILNYLIERAFFDKEIFNLHKVITSLEIQRVYQEAVKARGSKKDIIVDEKVWLLSPQQTHSFIKTKHEIEKSEINNSYSEINDSYSEINNSYSEINDSYSEINDSYSEINTTKESKVNKNKLNENKLNEIKQKESKVNENKLNEIKQNENKENLCSENAQGRVWSVYDKFNNICSRINPVKLLPNASREKAVLSLLENYGEDKIQEAFTQANASDFLCVNKNGYPFGFDWIIKPENFIKILEGNYKNKVTTQKTNKTSSYDLSEIEEMMHHNLPKY